MLRKALTTRALIPVIMSLQVIPLLLFPLSTWSLKNQDWWLPVLLTFLVVVALVQLLVRRSTAPWPWYLVSFAQGVNIISRIMMMMPHASSERAGITTFNGTYLILAVVAMLFSAFEIWYNELPEVRRKLLPA
jgi:hypothetical protein